MEYSGYVAHMAGSMAMGDPQKWMVFVRENPTKMDDDWGYHHSRKPTYMYSGIFNGIFVEVY